LGSISRIILSPVHDHPGSPLDNLIQAEKSKSVKMIQQSNWTEIEGAEVKMRIRVHGLSGFPRSNKQKVRVPEYTFSPLPLNLVQFGSLPISSNFEFPA